jgi:2-amino-4-hydroxy-6-hydroxymethyldihydropteridine diphosphokinase
MIFLGIGSNIGDKAAHLDEAQRRLAAAGAVVLRCSGYYDTAPWGVQEQAAFLNAVCEVSFAGSALQLLDRCLDIETDMGRVRQQKWGPRLIDIDLLEFHRERWRTERLHLPHPYYPQRDFVLRPFAELEPDWVPTGQTWSLTQLLANL